MPVGHYEEPGVSGALELEDRPEVQRLLADAEAGAEFGVLRIGEECAEDDGLAP